jgi:hypothetical protein
MRLVWSVSMTMCGRGMAAGTLRIIAGAQMSMKLATTRGTYTYSLQVLDGTRAYIQRRLIRLR